MDTPIYKYIGPVIEYCYQFISVSLEKEAMKVVRFSELEQSIYNLVLLDRYPDGSESNDMTETRNKDMPTVLATVMKIVTDFLHQYPSYFVHFQGSDARRARLYQILINREYDNLLTDYVVFGGIGDQYEIFEKGKTYQFFIITKKEKHGN